MRPRFSTADCRRFTASGGWPAHGCVRVSALLDEDVPAARRLIENGAPLDFNGVPPRPRRRGREVMNVQDGCSPLILACTRGLDEIVELLLHGDQERRADALVGAAQPWQGTRYYFGAEIY